MSVRRPVSMVVLALGVSVVRLAGAQEQRPHGPPPEAYDACTSKSKGDACTVSFHGTNLDGTCEAPPPDATDTRLACRPTHMPAPPDGGGAPPN